MPRKQPIPGTPPPEAWKPPKWEVPDAGALQALARGEADPHLQKRALDFIVMKLAGTYDMSYRPGSDRDTCFAEGRRFVGLEIVKLLNLNLAAFRKGEDGEPPPPAEQG